MKILACACAVAALAGCPPSSQKPDGGLSGPPRDNGGAPDAEAAGGGGAAGSGDGVRWPFWPTQMRIHPLTRAITDEASGLHLIEARLEFLDPGGETTKAVGELTLDLFPQPQALQAIQSWTLDLRDLAFNHERYDIVTRTYLFRLERAERDLPAGAILRATFDSIDGRELEATTTLR